jgi:hypothetical protein
VIPGNENHRCTQINTNICKNRTKPVHRLHRFRRFNKAGRLAGNPVMNTPRYLSMWKNAMFQKY